jgi:hypothetical protein
MSKSISRTTISRTNWSSMTSYPTSLQSSKSPLSKTKITPISTLSLPIRIVY